MELIPGFEEKVHHLDLNEIELSVDVIYAIDRVFRLAMFNTSWVTFALENAGSQVLNRYPLGSFINEAFGPARDFYETAYQTAIQTSTPFEQDYECSSASVFRIFRQTAYPLANGEGLLISNHLAVEKPHPDEPSLLKDSYLNQNGDIIQCVHCRKVKDNSHPAKWDWVPALVEHPAANVSHTFCPLCLEFYYPAQDDD